MEIYFISLERKKERKEEESKEGHKHFMEQNGLSPSHEFNHL
jgi:hypothetical protein